MHFSRRTEKIPALATLAALGLALVPQSARAQGFAFTTFDYPGAYYTIANGLNNSGQIVGSYGVTDGSGNQTTDGFTASAASLSSAGLTSYSTGDAFSELTAINDAGQTAGDYVKSDNTNPGFLLTGQSHADFLPSGYSSMVPFGINTGGVVSGTATDNSGISHVFVRSSTGTFTFLNDPSADAFGTSGGGNNDAGTVVGSYTNSAGGSTAFTESGGVFTDLTIPLSVSAAAFDINNLGDIVGQYRTGDTLNPSQGFLLMTGGTLITVNVPGAVSTEIRGVNDSLQLVGDYTDSSGNVHGFFATPAPEPSQYVAFAIGVLSIGVLGLRARKPSVRA